MGIFDPEIHNDRDRTLRCSLFKAPDRENWCEKRAGVEERESGTPFSRLRASYFSMVCFCGKTAVVFTPRGRFVHYAGTTSIIIHYIL